MLDPTESVTVEAASNRDDESRYLSAHEYDGIQEFDNPLPGWWRALFWATAVFAAGYALWFHGGWAAPPTASYGAALAEYNSGKASRDAADAANVSEEILARSAADPKANEHGAQVFAARCASCHTENGRGLIGPNLTDNFQIHGATRLDIFKTIRGGVPGTAMIAWSEQMPATDVLAVAAFVATLRGKNIAGKEPQGQPVEPFK